MANSNKISKQKNIQDSLNINFDSKNCCKDGQHQVKIGTILCNRYAIEQKLGSGGSSIVWQCVDKRTKRHVALKIIKDSNVYVETALHEIKMLQCVNSRKVFNIRLQNHSKFIQLLDYFKLSGVHCNHICIVLELMKGSLMDLFESPGGKQIILENSKNIIRQVLEAVHNLHTKAKLIHTDIKPDNILYNKIGNKLRIKIGDLGSACSIDEPISKGGQTVKYRSHEFLLKAPYNQSADIWSTACLAFDLTTLTTLFPSVKSKGVHSRDNDHLARTIAVLGKIPKHVALSGKLSHVFFTEDGVLRHVSRYRPKSLVEILTKEFKWGENETCVFADFLLAMLDFDPEKRPSALDCLNHPWLSK